jgi:hypothetical protein
MRDFSEKYRGTVYFGLGQEESADLFGQHDAWGILTKAVKATVENDVRSQELEDALCYLSRYAVRKRPFTDFRNGLSVADPAQRFMALKDAAHRIAKVLSG